MASTEHDSPTFPLDALASIPSFYHPTVAPHDDRIALYYDGSGRNELCLLETDSGQLQQISDGDVPRTARWWIGWDEGGDRLFFHRDEGGDEQNDIYAMDFHGETERIVRTEGQTILLETDPDGERLLYMSDESGQMNVWSVELATGSTTQLTDFEWPVEGGLFDPDGDRIAFAANETENLDNVDVYVAAADGSDRRRLPIGETGAETHVVDWHPDGDRILIEDNSEGAERIGVHDLDADETHWLSDGSVVEEPVAFTPDGDRIVGTRTRRAATVPIVYDRETGTDRELSLPTGVASFAGRDYLGGTRSGTFLPDDRAVLSLSTPAERPELLAYDLDNDEFETLLPADYGDIDPGAFVDAEYVSYASRDGTEIGAVFWDARQRPDADPSATEQPALVYVHGGPHGQTTRGFNEYVQFFVSRGYTVLGPNYRGSTGRGREFEYAVRGDWGGKEAEDIQQAAQWLKRQPWIDDDRVVVFGGSYGGYSTYVQLTRFPG